MQKYDLFLICIGIVFLIGILSAVLNWNISVILAPFNTLLLLILSRKELMEISKYG
jgi:uncharacterized membrane protein